MMSKSFLAGNSAHDITWLKVHLVQLDIAFLVAQRGNRKSGLRVIARQDL